MSSLSRTATNGPDGGDMNVAIDITLKSDGFSIHNVACLLTYEYEEASLCVRK